MYLIIAMQIPVTIAPGAVHDDGLAYRLAKNILLGHWLGEYNNLTLAKGAGFPIVLSINAILGIPITLFLALFYAATCYLVTNFLIKQKMPKFFAFFMFVLMLFHPAIFPLKIIRDYFYPALTLLVFTAIVSIIFENKQLKKSYVFFSGLIFGLFLITREEYVWILPGVLTLILLGIYYQRGKHQPLKPICLKLGLFFFIGFLIVNIISIINFHKYGIYNDVDFKEKEFRTALMNLNSVKISQEIPFVPVPKERREILYKISPSFAELRGFFEVSGKGWTKHGCQFYPDSCGEYHAGWFMWAFRDAVASKGYYKSAKEASAFYKKINEEVVGACNGNKIVCKKNIVPYMPNITSKQWQAFPKTFIRAVDEIISTSFSLNRFPSDNSAGNLFNYQILLGNPKLLPSSDTQKSTAISGWFYTPQHTWFSLNCEGIDGKKTIFPKRLESQDIVNAFKDDNANYQRFSFNISEENCFISSPNNKFINHLDLKVLEKERVFSLEKENKTLYIDNYSKSISKELFRHSFIAHKFLLDFYKYIIPVISFAGLLLFVVSTFLILLGIHSINPFWILSASVCGFFLTRVVLLVLIEISSFPGLNSYYFLPLYPLPILFSFLSFADMNIFIRNKKL